MVLDVAGGLAVLVCINQCHGIGGGGQQIRPGQFGGDLRPLGGEGGSKMRRGGGDRRKRGGYNGRKFGLTVNPGMFGTPRIQDVRVFVRAARNLFLP